MTESTTAPAANGEAAQMSEFATIANIFIEPGNTFEDLRRKPRFIIAGIIIALLVGAYSFGLVYKFGEAGMRSFIAAEIEKSPRTASMSASEKSAAVDLQMTISKVSQFIIPIFVAIAMLLGGLFYWLAAKAFGGAGGFLHNLSVFVYSSLPPTIVSMVASFIVMIFKSTDEIDLATSQRGLITASPALLMDGKAMPVLTTLIGTLDIFMIWGWILAAIGLRVTNKISSGSAWAITLIFALLSVASRVVGAYFSGNPS